MPGRSTRRPSNVHMCARALARFSSAKALEHVRGRRTTRSWPTTTFGSCQKLLSPPRTRGRRWGSGQSTRDKMGSARKTETARIYSLQQPVTQSQISFSKGYLICLVGSVWWYRTIIKHSSSNSSPKYTYIHTSPLLDFSSLLLMISFHSLIHDVILSSRGPILWSHRSLIHTNTFLHSSAVP